MSEVNLLFPNAGLGTLFDESMLFCACETQQYAVNGVTLTWGDIRDLTWHYAVGNMPNVPDMDAKDCYDAILKEISECCDLRFRMVTDPSKANLLIVQEPIDGPSGILGDCQMPVRPNPGTQLRLRQDKTDTFVISDHPPQGCIDLYTFGGHEIEHFCGVGHQPASIKRPARIQPFYNIAYRLLQDADKDELRRRYGPALAKPTEPPPAPVAPGSKPVWVRIEDGYLKVGQNANEWGVPMPGFTGKVEVTLPRTK